MHMIFSFFCNYFIFSRVFGSKPGVRMTLQNGLVLPAAKNCSHAVASTADYNNRNTLRWDLTPDQIKNMTESLVQRIKQVYDDIGSLDVEQVSIENTLKALANAKLEYAGKLLSDLGHTDLG